MDYKEIDGLVDKFHTDLDLIQEKFYKELNLMVQDVKTTLSSIPHEIVKDNEEEPNIEKLEADLP